MILESKKEIKKQEKQGSFDRQSSNEVGSNLKEQLNLIKQLKKNLMPTIQNNVIEVDYIVGEEVELGGDSYNITIATLLQSKHTP